MLKTVFLFILTAFFGLSGTFAQSHSEFGLAVGGFYYVGELNPDKHFLTGVEPGGGIVYRRVLNKRYALKFNALYGNLSASDQDYNEDFQDFRSYSFRSRIIEAAAEIEFNFFPYVIGDNEYLSTPFVFGGINVFYANPEASYTGGTSFYESEGSTSQSIISPAFVFGAGAKFTLLKKLGLSMEWGLRKTFRDDLDAVNNRYNSPWIQGFQKGMEENNDWYSFMGIMLTYRFNTKPQKCPAYDF